jgi:ATP-binding cassette subfamily B protein
MLKRLLSSVLTQYRGLLWLVVGFQLVQALAGLFLPTLNSDIINNGVVKNDVGYIWRMGGIMLLVTLAQVIFSPSMWARKWPWGSGEMSVNGSSIR